jgi:excisionase family DNA binding protein
MASNATASPSPLALRPREAAKALGLSERSLWALTSPRGPIPAAKVGRSVLYSYRDLEAWLASEAAKSAPTANHNN